MYISTNISDNHKQLIRYDIISITKFHPPTKPTLFQQKSFDPENQSNSTQSLQLVLRFLNIPTFQFPNRCPFVSVSHPVYPKRCPERKSGFVAWRVSFPETTEAGTRACTGKPPSLRTILISRASRGGHGGSPFAYCYLLLTGFRHASGPNVLI